MTNREKYRFDDYTLDNYNRLVNLADSLGYWRYDRLEDMLNDKHVKHLQVLTHDGNWSEGVLSPRKRFSKVMHNHAERLVCEQVNGLHENVMLCPDYEED